MSLRPRAVGGVRKCMEGFMTRGWELIIPRCGSTSILSGGETIEARWLYVPSQTAVSG